MDEEDILKSFSQTEVGLKIEEIRKVYEELEEKQKKFCEDFSIHCKNGCGECCEHFDPDITETEALFLAYGLIQEHKDEEVLNVLANASDDSIYCPLYNFLDKEHHCTIYKWRPLICRLFGASASKNKEGEPVFRQCKFNNDKTLIETTCLKRHMDDLIFMGDYGLRLDEIDANNRKTMLVKEALPMAINKIKFILELEIESENN